MSGVVSLPPNPQTRGWPSVGCPWLNIQYIRTLPPYLDTSSAANWGCAIPWWQGANLTWTHVYTYPLSVTTIILSTCKPFMLRTQAISMYKKVCYKNWSSVVIEMEKPTSVHKIFKKFCECMYKITYCTKCLLTFGSYSSSIFNWDTHKKFKKTHTNVFI